MISSFMLSHVTAHIDNIDSDRGAAFGHGTRTHTLSRGTLTGREASKCAVRQMPKSVRDGFLSARKKPPCGVCLLCGYRWFIL